MNYLYLFIALLCLLPSCSNEHPGSANAPRRTVLIYLGGNNNLSGEVDHKIDSITAGWHNEQDNLLIYRAARYEAPALLQVVGHPAHPFTQLVKTYPESGATTAERFSEVIQDALTLYPARSYGLLLFSHGTGWLPEGMFVRPRSASVRSIVSDNGHEMEIADFAAAIPDHTFDFIVLEACLMSGVEVAYELRNKADYLVASSAEILSPGFTPVYPELINRLFEQPAADLKGFARRYYEHCDGQSGVYQSCTISLLNLHGMEDLGDIASFALSSPDTRPVDISTIQCFDRGEEHLFFDFGDYMQQVNPGAYEAVEAVLDKVVLYKAATPTFIHIPIRRHSGLTVYIEQSTYPELNAAYRTTSWKQQSNISY